VSEVSSYRLLGGKASFIQQSSNYSSQPPDAVGKSQERQGNDMHILVISRSTGRSRRRVVSLMDSYAVRTGESSWSTPITREALAELRAALRRVASRTACVGCYINVGRSRLRLAWTVGRGAESNRPDRRRCLDAPQAQASRSCLGAPTRLAGGSEWRFA